MLNKIAVIVGSLRRESFNRKTAKALMKVASDSIAFELVEIDKLSLYNQDLEDTPPAEWVEFRNKLNAFDGVLFFTPEYNRSVPGVLKNAIDIGSRPSKQSVWSRKPCGVISVSVGAFGGFGANHHLRQSLVVLGMPTMPSPEVYIGGASKLFNENGELIDDSTQKLLKLFAENFAIWVENNKKR